MDFVARSRRLLLGIFAGLLLITVISLASPTTSYAEENSTSRYYKDPYQRKCQCGW